jgi:hypothetical protein
VLPKGLPTEDLALGVGAVHCAGIAVIANQIKMLRIEASGKFISASRPGAYEFQESAPAARTGRAFRGMDA